MNSNHRFILRPLVVSVFVAMSATGCAIDDDMNATRHANLIINHADPLAISAKEAHKRAELAKNVYGDAIKHAKEAIKTAQIADAKLANQANDLQNTINNKYHAWLEIEKEAQSLAKQKYQAGLDNDNAKKAELAKLEAQKQAHAKQLFAELEAAKVQANELLEQARIAKENHLNAEQAKAQEEAKKKAEEEAAKRAQEAAKQLAQTNTQIDIAITINKEATNALNYASNQAKQAKTQADSPDTAQYAISQAQSALNTAQSAITQAQSAITQAQSALQVANTIGNQDAINRAKHALNDANTTLEQAQQAKQQAEQVITQAQGVIDNHNTQQQNHNTNKINTIIATAKDIHQRTNDIAGKLDDTKQTADTATEQAAALISTENALKNAEVAQTQAVQDKTQAEQALNDAKKALNDAQAISANNEAISIAQTAVASAEEVLKRTETILAQTKATVEQVAVTEARAYIMPTADAVVKNNKPTYERQANIAQPTAKEGTITGYSNMDEQKIGDKNQTVSNKTEIFYGLSQQQYAKKLHELKSSIDTTGLNVGVIDSGIYPKNPDLDGANLSGTNLVDCSDSSHCTNHLPYAQYKPVNSHGSKMAAIIAGNNGMTNATIHAYTDGDKSNEGDEFTAMLQLNKTHGVQIFNNSWGYTPDANESDNQWLNTAIKHTPDGDTKNSTHPQVRAIHELIVNKDALLIHAAGNETKETTYGERLAPELNPIFKKGFLAVSSPREDFAHANYCGQAATWCLAAPSTSYSHNNEGKLEFYKGTSPATARVTGTALLVKGAYPWMKNENLVQTLLSTAQDFDEIKERSATHLSPVPVKESEINRKQPFYYTTDAKGNKTFFKKAETPWQERNAIDNIGGKNITWQSGWGLLDTVAATQGYGGFYWNNVVLDVSGKDTVSVFSNNIKGEHGFTKAGDGKLVLTGDNRYQGETIIQNGILEINGNNASSTINLTGGELTGYGTTGSIKQTGGAVNNEGNLSIHGSYTMNDDSTLKAKFGNLLNVTGKAQVDGTLDLYDEIQDGLIKETGSKTTVLRAGELSGKFDKVKSSNALFSIIKTEEYSGRVGTDGRTTPNATTKTDVVVSAKRNKLTTMGSESTASIGRRMVEQNIDKVLSELDTKDDVGTLTAHEMAFATGFANKISMATNKSTLDKFGTPAIINDKYNETLFALDPAFYANNAIHAIEQSSTQATNFAKNMANAPNGVWLKSIYQTYELDLPSSQSERKTRNQSIGVAKTDERVGLGLQLDLGHLELDEQNGSTNHNIKTDLTALTVGMSGALGNNTKGTLWAKAGVLGSDAKNNTNAKQKYDGQLYAGGVHLGTSYVLSPNTSIKPYIGVSYRQYQHDNANFNDGVVMVKDIDATHWQGTIGVDTHHQISPQWQIQVGLQYDNAFKQDATVTSAYLGTNTDVVFDAWETGKDKIQASLGTSYQIDPKNRLSLDYDYFKSEKSDGDRVQLTLNSRF
ncbi:autotransporter domain-containing protein [Moraxella nonliquefaciens]|uniref:S8 family serine peptidase n=1 Tax=Moraxella nonliquefaciens TaxID=478 RepID=UPI0024A68C6F|nr:S8 family serine peptidase [Moraxella nonliquefaciens]MDI4498419.1 autotransporter domain-containing protein [Moraxella nonliquefaciens]MDI4500213.1 autotransporter domain-containing protein [Moraxella nonliquefaciens]